MQGSTNVPERTIGVDVGDRYSRICILDGEGEIVEEGRVRTTAPALSRRFAKLDRARVVLEVGPHSPWISRLIAEEGHEVIVANPRKLRLIYENDGKCDRADAEYLARVGRLDPRLLAPVTHRGEDVQADLAVIRSRAALVEARTALINHMRSTVKALGGRLPKCSTKSFHRKVEEHVPELLQPAMLPVLDTIAELTAFDAETEIAGPLLGDASLRSVRDQLRRGRERISREPAVDSGAGRGNAHGAVLHADPGAP